MLAWARRRAFQIIRKYISAESGVFAPIAAIMFMALMGVVGVGVDIGSWLMQKRALQTAVDAGALAGAYELANQQANSAVDPAALRAATASGYDPATANSNISVIIHADGDASDGCDHDCPSVEVTLWQTANSWFATLIYHSPVIISTTATAIVEANDGVFCMLSLDPTANHAITTSGSVTIDAQGCGMAVNSNSDTSLYLNGNVIVNVGDVHLAGNYDVVGGAAQFTYTNMRLHTTQTRDPYADLAVVGQPSSCTQAQQNAGPTHINGDTVLSPGVFCGGITISGNETVTLNPGTYYMDGGDFAASGQGAITGTGVTIVLTNSGGAAYGAYGNMDITGGKSVSLSAPTSGYYEGVAIYQDRNAPSPCSNSMTGSVGLQVDGTIYTPSCGISFGGNGAVTSTADVCSKIISKTITYHGNPAIGSNCDGKETRSIGAPAVKLVI